MEEEKKENQPQDQGGESQGNGAENSQDSNNQGNGQGIPRKPDGSADIDAMTPEQKAEYYKNRADEQTRGFNDYKKETDNKLAELASKIDNPQGEKSPELTEEELRKQIPGYDTLSSEQKELMKSVVAPLNENVAALQKQVAEILDKDKFQNDLNSMLGQDRYKVLQKHKAAFKEFAYQSANLNTPLNILADSYILQNELNKAPQQEEKREGLENGHGGGTPPREHNNKELSVEEITRLRTQDPKKYARLVREGKIRTRK